MTNTISKSQTSNIEEASKPNRETLLDSCRHLAESNSILDELDESLKQHGFAGPTDIPKLIFLSLITRVFERPVSAVIKGPSSSGKSFALHAALRYVPKSAYEEFQGLSDRALVYSGDLNLQHRHIVMGEAAGLADGTGRTFLRQLLTEDEIRYRTVQQTKEGHAGRELIIKGPVGLLMTTTASSLHWEDETRLLTLHVDQSPQQIKRALMTNAGEGPTKPSADDLSRWHSLYDYVCSGNLEVEIPYTTTLLDRVPHSHGRVLRDIPKVLALLRAHALLHQQTRKRNDKGNVIADLYDYYVVHGLVGEPLAQGLQESVPPHIREVVNAVNTRYDNSDRHSISITELAAILGRDQSVVSRNVNAAVQAGYLEDQNPGQGRRSMLIPGERKLPSGTVLPSPQDLFLDEKLSQTDEALAQLSSEPALIVPQIEAEWDFVNLPH